MDLKRRHKLFGLLSGVLATAAVLMFAVRGGQQTQRDEDYPPRAGEPAASAPAADADDDADAEFAPPRRRMVAVDLQGRDISDRRVLDAMAAVPRHRFVPEDLTAQAYSDHPLPIGHGQTISQPYIVALMTQLAGPKPDSRVLDVGTGSGYQAAILAEMAGEVYSIEIVESLADDAAKRLAELGYENITVRSGDGYQGWQEKAPFDAIVVAAAPDHVPQPLVDQLSPGGRLVIPVGEMYQELLLIEKAADGTINRRSVIPVQFVPMTGEAQAQKP